MRVPSAVRRLDFHRLFEFGPELSIVLSPEQNYAIVAVTEAYLRATMTNREEIVGRSLFDVFSDNPCDSGAYGVRDNVRLSIEKVVRTGRADIMPLQKYDICRSPDEGGGFEERYWRPINSPLFSADGSVGYVIHRVEDVTELVKLKQHDDEDEQRVSVLQSRAEHSEAELFLRGREIQDLNSRLRAADAAQLDLQASQLVSQTEQLHEANTSLRELTARLLQIQDEERRRIARELHDSLGQMLAAQGMYLSSVAAESRYLSVTAAEALKDSTKLIEEMSRELRTISYLLHPPLLDEAGLASAIRWFAEGFAERSKIIVNLELSPALGRLSEEFEIAIFRIVQESLTNIHRHSGSPSATIRLELSPEEIILEIKDQGRGIPLEKRTKAASGKSSGIGIRGMRERIAQLGGKVEINSNAKGTAIVARLPVANTSCSQPMAAGNSA
jgi:signal transduction histidine kinase